MFTNILRELRENVEKIVEVLSDKRWREFLKRKEKFWENFIRIMENVKLVLEVMYEIW